MQRDILIIGGGLTGLAAAFHLETSAQAGHLTYSLIEVKRRLGGSIASVTVDGAILDSGPFVLAPSLTTAAADWLARVRLADALVPHPNGLIFAGGTQTLVDALAQRLTGPRLMRMAASSIGDLNAGGALHTLCMENGLILNARALIVALPARYAERLFYSYRPPVSEMLRAYRYDQIVRVSLVYRRADLPDFVPEQLPDMAVAFIQRADGPPRVAADRVLFQVGLRLDPTQTSPDALMQTAARLLGIQAAPTAHHIAYWPEADPLSCHDDDHPARMAAIRAALPPSVALVGSDYSLAEQPYGGVTRLDDRLQQGRDAAQHMLDLFSKRA